MSDLQEGLVPERLCAHADLRDSTLSRARCRDCGAFVDVEDVATITGRELETEIRKAEKAGYEHGFAEGGEDELTDLEETILQRLRDWRTRLHAAVSDLVDADDDSHDDLFTELDGITEEMRNWRA